MVCKYLFGIFFINLLFSNSLIITQTVLNGKTVLISSYLIFLDKSEYLIQEQYITRDFNSNMYDLNIQRTLQGYMYNIRNV